MTHDAHVDAAQAAAEEASWPTTLGVVSLLYAAGGGLCVGGFTTYMMFVDRLMKMGGMTVTVPAWTKGVLAASGCAVLALAVMLAVGAVGLMRRRREGLRWLRRWVILRLLLLAAGQVVVVATAPVQTRILIAASERGGMGQPDGPLSEDAAWRRLMIQNAVGAAIVAAYPTFLGFYLSSRKVREQSQRWT